MPKRKGKKSEDVNQTAHRVVTEATGEIMVPITTMPSIEQRPKDPLAVELGRRGGLVGGRKRAQNLSKDELSKIGRLGAKARWQKKP